MSFKDMILPKVGRQLLILQKHSPKILFVAGVAGVVGAAVLTARATMKLEQVLENHEKTAIEIGHAAANVEGYSEEDAQRDSVILLAKTSMQVAKLYAPAVLVGVAAIAALTGSHVILSNRMSAVTAAYAVLDRGFRQYRERVVNELGPQKDAEFRYGAEDCDIIEETEEGPVVKTVKRPTHGRSIYARFFDEGSTQWKKNHMHNQFFIRSQQDYANDMLRAYGHLFLNDVYRMLGLEPTQEGQLVGWVRNNPRGGDNYIDFGVFENDMFIAQQWVSGDERSILLDFNVDGVVYDLLGSAS